MEDVNIKTKAEIGDIVSWMSGYISVIQGHPRLKKEIRRLENLVLGKTKTWEDFTDEEKAVFHSLTDKEIKELKKFPEHRNHATEEKNE